MAEQAIYSQLSGVAALGNRVYPDKLPQNVAYPAAVYQQVGPENRYPTFKRDTAGLVEATIQVDVYGQSSQGKAAFDAVAQAVRRALQRKGSGNVEDMFIDTGRNEYEEDTDLYRKSYDVRAWYRET